MCQLEEQWGCAKSTKGNLTGDTDGSKQWVNAPCCDHNRSLLEWQIVCSPKLQAIWSVCVVKYCYSCTVGLTRHTKSTLHDFVLVTQGKLYLFWMTATRIMFSAKDQICDQTLEFRNNEVILFEVHTVFKSV